MIERFFRPFFAGVFLESELQTSSRMLQFVFAMFAAGDAALPAAGMEAIPRQLAARLPADRIRLKAEATRIDGTAVWLASGERLQARAIVVATDGPSAARLVEGLPSPASRSVTCVYFAAEKPPIDEPVLVLGADGDGPVNNMCVPSGVAPSYAPAGAASDFGVRGGDASNIRCELGIFLCGDHRENPSIQGAMASAGGLPNTSWKTCSHERRRLPAAYRSQASVDTNHLSRDPGVCRIQQPGDARGDVRRFSESPQGMQDWEASADFGLPQILSVMGVRTRPGATALTRIPFDA